jgi:hypothetical protein
MDQAVHHTAFDFSGDISVLGHKKIVVNKHIETVVSLNKCTQPPSFHYDAFSSPSSYQPCPSKSSTLREDDEIPQAVLAIAGKAIVGKPYYLPLVQGRQRNQAVL